jgi:hypothetical protein
MPDPDQPGGVPSDVPPEYAEAYRRGYERAFAEAQRAADADEGDGPAGDEQDPGAEHTHRLDELLAPYPEDEPARPSSPGARSASAASVPGPATSALTPPAAALAPPPAEDRVTSHPSEAERQFWGSEERRRRLVVPLLLGGLALLLVVAAYGMGKIFAGSVSDVDASSPADDGVALGDGSGGQGNDQSGGSKDQQREAYGGKVTAAAIGSAKASCQSESSVDAAGNPVSYPPRNMYDGDLTTAWRCDGRGSGERIVLRLPAVTEIGQVGMVPGYAKTDARSGADRYAQNNRITRVRWRFGSGPPQVQRLDGSAKNRSMQTIRIPATKTRRVVIEILGSKAGPRNTVAISEVRIGKTAG